MNIIKLNECELYIYLNTPFNPPIVNSYASEKEFEEEWWSVRFLLSNVLDQFGQHNDYGEEDYTLGESISLSRGIGVELTSSKMLKGKLISSIISMLGEVNHVYEVDLSIINKMGVNHIFINKDRILVWCSPEILISLGLE